MEKTDQPPKQAEADREMAGMVDQAALKRAVHKIAWTRMNGRNDAMNPFAEANAEQPTGEDARQESAHAPSVIDGGA
jgi:hypothetical protein